MHSVPVLPHSGLHPAQFRFYLTAALLLSHCLLLLIHLFKLSLLLLYAGKQLVCKWCVEVLQILNDVDTAHFKKLVKCIVLHRVEGCRSCRILDADLEVNISCRKAVILVTVLKFRS